MHGPHACHARLFDLGEDSGAAALLASARSARSAQKLLAPVAAAPWPLGAGRCGPKLTPSSPPWLQSSAPEICGRGGGGCRWTRGLHSRRALRALHHLISHSMSWGPALHASMAAARVTLDAYGTTAAAQHSLRRCRPARPLPPWCSGRRTSGRTCRTRSRTRPAGTRGRTAGRGRPRRPATPPNRRPRPGGQEGSCV